jgi:hypothetical protein
MGNVTDGADGAWLNRSDKRLSGHARKCIAFRIQVFSWANSLCPEQGKHMMRKTGAKSEIPAF